MRIPLPVIAFMMVEGSVRHMFDQGEILQHFPAFYSVSLHDGVFFVRKAARFIQDAVRDADLADVMKPGGFAEVFAFLLAVTELTADHVGVLRHAVRVLAGPGILGVNRLCDGHDRLVSHLNLLMGQGKFTLLHIECPLHLCSHEEPGKPGDCQHGDDKQIELEPAVVVDLFGLDERVGPLFQDFFFFVVKYGQMERVIARGQVRVGDGTQAALGRYRPLVFKSFQIIADKGILYRVIDDFRDKLDPADAAVYGDRRVFLRLE